MQSLPVLRLPYLALIEVLKCWNPIELFTFAQCSKKAALVIPLAGTSNFLLDLECPSTISINDDYVIDIKYIGQEIVCYGSTGTRSIQLNHQHWLNITSPFTDVWGSFQTVGVYLTDLFKCPVTTYVHSPAISMEQFLQFGQKIVQKQTPIKDLFIGYHQSFVELGTSQEDLKALLNGLSTLKVTESLFIYDKLHYDNNVQFNISSTPKCFLLRCARWFTRIQLLSLANCTLIDLYLPGLVHKDVNEFVNLWRWGEFSALKYFQVKLNFERNFPIGGLINLKNYANRMRRIKKIYRHTYDVLEGAVIQRDDGRKADVRLNFWEEKFQLLVHSEKDTFEYVELITID